MKVHRVHVVGCDHLISKMFDAQGYHLGAIEEADTLVFSGGADVPPEMYGEQNVASNCQPAREIREKDVWERFTGKKNMIGICRGSQFLNVMNGGKLWQHVDNHGITGTHGVLDILSGEVHQCTSTHHQMMRPADHGILVAVADQSMSTARVSSEGVRDRVEGEDDVEVVWYPETLSLCFQGHPEYGVDECKDYFFELVDKLYKKG